MLSFIKKKILSYKNKKRIEKDRNKEFQEVLSKVNDPAEAESIMWCRKHGWSDDGEIIISKKPKLRLVKR